MLYSKLRKVSARSIGLVVIFLLLTSAIASAAPQADKVSETTIFKIVAVGDSVTAGYEYGFTEQSIPYGFADHVYEQALFHGLRTEYINYGVLGLRTTGLKRWMEAVVQNVAVKSEDIQSKLPDPRADRIFNETKQLRSALSNANLIVMTIGGNDMYNVLAKLEAGANQTEAAATRDQSLQTFETELEASLRLMLSLQPNAQIVIADQYLPIPAPIKVGALTFPLYPEADRLFLIECLNLLRDRLHFVVEQLMLEGFNLSIANVASSFMNNELSYTSIAKGDIHPSRAGYAAMGKAFTKTIWGDYRVTAPRESGEPISIIVNGKELKSTNKPLLVQNKTYVPLRNITEAVGAAIHWNAASQTASVKLQGRTVDIAIGGTAISVNGQSKTLQAPPAFLYKNGNTSTVYVPLAALSEALQFQVIYRDTLKTVFINS